MPRIEKPDVIGTVFKVQFTEYERGWGSKPDGQIYFDNEQEAREFADKYNREHNNESVVPDYYILATYAGPVR